MPIPFTHLAQAQRLINDPVFPSMHRDFLTQYFDVFLLGNIVPDGHHFAADLRREDTHFFVYQPQIDPLAEVVMLSQFPTLTIQNVGKNEQAAFIGGYLAHLALDEVWCELGVMPFFLTDSWGPPWQRHFLFIALVTLMAERDYANLPSEHYRLLASATSHNWLSFLPDLAIHAWRDRVAKQMAPGAKSETLEILGKSVRPGYEALVELVHSPEKQDQELWCLYSKERLMEAEAATYQHMLQVVCNYLDGNY